MGPTNYYSKRHQMSADLKVVAKRVRAAKPEYFEAYEHRTSSMDGDGKVTVENVKTTKANRLSPAARHGLAMKAA